MTPSNKVTLQAGIIRLCLVQGELCGHTRSNKLIDVEDVILHVNYFTGRGRVSTVLIITVRRHWTAPLAVYSTAVW